MRMKKISVSLLCGCLITKGLFGQSSDLERILQEVELNNKELIAFSKYIEGKKLELASTNNLPDPQVAAFYLPFGNHANGDYSEFQISQSFEFPSIYGARSKWIESRQELLQQEFEARRKDILLEAKQHGLELIFLSKLKNIESGRLELSRRVFDQTTELFEGKQISILVLNKAKIVWLQQQFLIKHLEARQQDVLLLLENLNGGVKIDWTQTTYSDDLSIPLFEKLWQSTLVQDPELVKLKYQQSSAQQALRISKNQSLPDLALGYNYQGVRSDNFSGLYAGISIPLWSNRSKVKAAKSNLDYQSVFQQSYLSEKKTDVELQLDEYRLLFLKYNEYASTIPELASEQKLMEAYELGELSFMEYYSEINFYQEAIDAMLEMEYELHKLKSNLLKHQL